MAEKYNASNVSIEQILNFIKSGEIAIPEIQRPFVWKPKQVRDLIDSLYTGYPTGYLIISQSPNMKLKDGSLSEGKKIMIDGQQRVTALMTSIIGMEVIDSEFEKKRIKISFNPLAIDEDEVFKVQDNAILKDKKWIADIAEIFKPDFKRGSFVSNYCESNPEIDSDKLHDIIDNLIGLKNRQIGVITLDRELTIDEVTEIFIRINSQGAKLNQSDFAMSKIAANVKYGGNSLRKAIDYFSHLAVQPDWYSEMSKDKEFMESKFAQKIKWLKDDKEEIFDPGYGDILRVAFMYKFGRGKMKDLVSLLGGRDFETRDYKEEIAENSFAKLTDGVLDFMNEFSFTNFVLAIKSAGFISNKLINSQMTLDFAYTLYLILNNNNQIDKTQIKHYVSKWYVFSTLTSRYITSPESVMDLDIRRISEKGFLEYFKEIEEANLSNTFWEVGLVQDLETSAINSPFFNVFLAAQVHGSDNSLLMNGTKVRDLITTMGDIHHIFPKGYLQKKGITDKSKYNQIANYTYLDTQTNISVGEKAPNEYFRVVFEQCNSKEMKFGNITDITTLKENLKTNCIPENIVELEVVHYENFLLERRKLMAKKIKDYYFSL
ncbi:MAG: GmrSD restriction endonuclease domain-containing protein [Breznakibacter sp.]